MLEEETEVRAQGAHECEQKPEGECHQTAPAASTCRTRHARLRAPTSPSRGRRGRAGYPAPGVTSPRRSWPARLGRRLWSCSATPGGRSSGIEKGADGERSCLARAAPAAGPSQKQTLRRRIVAGCRRARPRQRRVLSGYRLGPVAHGASRPGKPDPAVTHREGKNAHQSTMHNSRMLGRVQVAPYAQASGAGRRSGRGRGASCGRSAWRGAAHQRDPNR